MGDGEQNRRFDWDERRLLAADLVADGRLSDEAIAAKCDVSRTTIYQWKRHPAFSAKVQALIEAIEASILNRGIARRARRVQAKNDRWRRLRRIVAERAKDPSMADIPGGKTGLLVRTVKVVGQGEAAREVHEFAVDAALLAEMRSLEKDAAIEVGQWLPKKDVAVRPQPMTALDLGLLSEEQLGQLEAILATVEAQREAAESAPAGVDKAGRG